jgi:membrane-associated phospholipid phosphatase
VSAIGVRPEATGRAELSRRLCWTTFAYLAWIASYEGVGWYARTLPTRDLSLSIDAMIPFMPTWVWVYELTYVLPFVALFAIEDARRFDRALRAILLAAVSAYAVYLLLPVAFGHPALGTSLAERMLAVEYRYDFPPGANHLPSLHVANAVLLYEAVRGQRLGREGERIAFVLCLAIAASTLFVKQHIVADVVAGVAWGEGAWWVAGWRPRARMQKAARERAQRAQGAG